MNPQAYAELSGRLDKAAPHATMMLNCLNRVFAVGAEFDEARAKVAKDLHLSDVGRNAKVAEIARAKVREVLEAAKPQRGAMAQVIGQRLHMKPKPVKAEDARGELRRAEVRSYVRSLDASKRIGAALQLAEDDEALGALLDASPMLSGLPADQYAHLEKIYRDRHFSDQIAKLDGVEADCTVVGGAVEMAMSTLRQASGLNDHQFTTLVAETQAEVDGGK